MKQAITAAADHRRTRDPGPATEPQAQPYLNGIPRGLQAQAEAHTLTVARMDDGRYTLIDQRGYSIETASSLTDIATALDKQIRLQTWASDLSLVQSLRDRAEALGVIWDGTPDKKGRYTLHPPGRGPVKGTIMDLIDLIDRWEQNKALTEIVRPMVDTDNQSEQYWGALEAAAADQDRAAAGTAAMALAVYLLGLNGNQVLECLELVLSNDQWDRLSQAL